MPTPKLDPKIHRRIQELKRDRNMDHRDIATLLKVSVGTVSNCVRNPLPVVERSNKKRGEFNWREVNPWIKRGQEIKKKASYSQDEANIILGDGKKPVILATLSDMHIGSWGADHEMLEKITDELLSIEPLYVALLGDYGEYAISLRGVLETCSQILPPDLQTEYIESWFEEIWHKVAWATFDNHNITRSEKAAGESSLKKMISKKVVYHNGIGHVDIKVGEQIYRIASSHRFRGSSILNPVHACMRYLRMEAPDREIAMMGDLHVPGMAQYAEGGGIRIAINTGTLHANSGYAKRWFSLKSHPVFPCIVLRHDRHEATPFWSIQAALTSLR
jgi:hypothetical protein